MTEEAEESEENNSSAPAIDKIPEGKISAGVYVDTVDLGYSQYGLDLFELYELPIKDAVDY